MSKCLILGANGFIGSHLVDTLVKKGYDIRAFDRFSEDEPRFDGNDSIEIISGDFLNRDDLAHALTDVDYVFHFISTTTPASVENDPSIDIETNIRMSVALFEECVKAKIKKVIFASTGGAIYGDNSSAGVKEDVTPLPVSPYAIGKLTIEHYLRYFKHKYGLNSVTYRISNPYGERQSLSSKQGVIPIFLSHIARNEPLTILGDGTMVRDYIYVKDAVSMVAQSFEKAQHHLYNLGSGHGYTINELVETMKDITGKDLQIDHKEVPSTYVEKIVLDTMLLNDEFNIFPKVELSEGIAATWQYVEQQVGSEHET